MDEIILNFEGDTLPLQGGFATERSLSQLGMKVEHKGQMYQVTDRYVLGVDEVSAELLNCGDAQSLKNKLTMVIMLKKI